MCEHKQNLLKINVWNDQHLVETIQKLLKLKFQSPSPSSRQMSYESIFFCVYYTFIYGEV